MKKMISGFLNFITICTVCAQDFSYEGIHGPEFWGQKYETCVGKHQSPINIEEHRVRSVALPPLRFSGFDLPRRITLTNNGHTVLLKAEGSRDAFLTGGPLGNGSYIFEQLHFHWGENDWEGSEDRINNHSFAMELHAVFYKSIYGSSAKATNHPDGLTVLAYFFEAGEVADPNYNDLVEGMAYIKETGTQHTLVNHLYLESILMTNRQPIQRYFTYNGSLTTPPCSEVVTWIDFKEPHILSHKQIAAFRRIRSAAGEAVTHNFRPVQPLEDRIVLENIPELTHRGHEHPNHRYHQERNSGEFNSAASILTVILSLLLAFDR